MKIGFIGAGNMASAIIKSFLDTSVCSSDEIFASDKNEEKLAELKKENKINTSTSNLDIVKKSEIIILAVKPQIMNLVLEEIKDSVCDNQIILTIAAGIKINTYESILGRDKKIIRVMPNTPCLVGELAAGYSINKNITANEEKTIHEILNKIGVAYKVDESLIKVVTSLSGCGPAFTARIIEYFVNAGIEQGLKKEIAYELMLKTFLGTAKLLKNKKMQPEELIKIVSSPNGTTVAGREILENSEMQEIIKNTIKKAIKRSDELS